MYLARLHIDGYGIFSNFGLPADSEEQTFSKNLSVVVGPNESGKTTLLSFLRSILFGFLNGRSKENLYPPVNRGKHGGLVTLIDGQGEKYLVARYAGTKGGTVRITMPDGSTGGTAELDLLLGHASKDLFKNVFAFGLDELQDFETLSGDDMSARIYSAGIGAGRLSLGNVEAKLENKRGELFTTDRATSKEITGLLRECAETRRKLAAIEGQVSEYSRLYEGLLAISGRLDEQRKARDERRKSLDHCDNLLRAWQPWTEMQEAKERLSELATPERFPTDGISRLEVILERIRSENQRAKDKEAEIEGLQEQLAQINVNRALLDRASEVNGLERGLAKYVSAREDSPKVQTELKGQIEDLNCSLSNLGPGWDEQRVTGFDTSISARESIRSYDARLAEKRQHLQAAGYSAEQLSVRLGHAREELQRLKQKPGTIPKPSEHDRAVVETRLRSAKLLLAGLTDYHIRLQERDALENRSADREAYVNSILRQIARNTEMAQLPVAITVVLLVIPIVGWLVLLHLRRKSSRLQNENSDLQDNLRRTRAELKSIRARTASILSDLQKEEDRLKAAAQSAGLDGIASASETNDHIAMLDNEMARLAVWQAATDKVAEAAELADGLERHYQAAAELKRQAEEEMARAEKDWTAWLQRHAISTDCLPTTALEILSKVENAREKVDNITHIRERVTDIERSMTEYEDATNSVLKACGDAVVTRAELPGVVDKLIDRWKTAQEANERMERLQQDIGKKAEERDKLQRAQKSAQDDLQQLLSEAGVEDEESFRQRQKVFDEAAGLRSVIEQRRRALEQIAGRKEALEAFVSELESTTPEKLQETRRLVDDELQSLVEEMERAIDERRGIKDELDELEHTEEASNLRLQLSVLQERLKAKALEWVALTIGQNLLRQARAKYERERKPAVVQQGQHFFSMITNDRYPRLISPPGETQIQLEDSSGHRKTLAELSRGTAEQLYLALRFGLIREFSRRSESLPVVMDDILVNFDPQRANEAARAIAELAKDNQVVVFTCHPNTVDLLTSHAPQALILKLQNHQA